MIKQAPTRGRILAMVVFALSCFAIALSMWIQFGGTVPLRPQSYRVQIAFPQGTGITKNIDVRAAGIPIGAVVDSEVDRAAGRALATIELEAEYAPLSSDARAILRRKTLLGETFVEIATGSASAPKLADGGRLDDARVAKTVELDEVLQTYDPTTRRAFRIWQQELGTAIGDRGESVNNALGQLPDFTRKGTDLLAVLDEQETAVRGLVRDTGAVYSALSQDEGQLRALIENSHGVFSQTADAARLARRGDPDLPRVPGRVEDHARAARAVLTRHAAAGARPAPGGARAAPHRELGACARARPEALLPALRPADRARRGGACPRSGR